MAENSKIEWTDHTWSPWEGCQKVGPGCDHCYAEARNDRFRGGNWGPGAPRRKTAASGWKKPVIYDRAAKAAGVRKSIFPSLCDPFDNAVDASWRDEFANLIVETPNLDWLLLTKRIGNADPMLADMFPMGIPSNIMVGATMVNQPEVDRDWAKLAAVNVRRVFVSIEPMLGGIVLPRLLLARLAWVIAGGESGPQARPSHPDWYRSLRDQCATAGVPFLFKQWGEWAPAIGMASTHRIYRDGQHRPVREIERIDGTTLGIARLGKKPAGRLLDGVEHNGIAA